MSTKKNFPEFNNEEIENIQIFNEAKYREVGATIKFLDEIGETNLCGLMDGWKFSFEKIKKETNEEMN